MAFRRVKSERFYPNFSLEKEKIGRESEGNDRTTEKQFFRGRCKNNYFIDNKKRGG